MDDVWCLELAYPPAPPQLHLSPSLRLCVRLIPSLRLHLSLRLSLSRSLSLSLSLSLTLSLILSPSLRLSPSRSHGLAMSRCLDMECWQWHQAATGDTSPLTTGAAPRRATGDAETDGAAAAAAAAAAGVWVGRTDHTAGLWRVSGADERMIVHGYTHHGHTYYR